MTDRGDGAVHRMRYDGYEAAVAFDEDAALFHGEVLHLRDVITFQGRTLEEAEMAFAESVEDYKDFCKRPAQTSVGSA
jgi:predicted HicB family RNase H-like nuclease